MKLSILNARTRLLVFASLSLLFSVEALSQPKPKVSVDIQSTPAYAELLLKKTELEAEIGSLLIDFTEEYPKVKELRIQLDLLKIEINRLLAVRPAESGKLTLALGKLMLGKVGHAALLKRLQANYQDSHPDVRREKKQVEIFEAAIKEILD